MKNIFIVVKNKWLIGLACVILSAGIVVGAITTKSTITPKKEYCIVIDAGHGGRDGGAIGRTTGITESELNLKYALQLKELCEDYGMKVVLTRENMDGLYDEGASNKKRSEMEKRRQIINNSDADLMVSIHMNSFSSRSTSGAYVFYAKESKRGQTLARTIQSSLSKSFDDARGYVTVGDYFVLNYSTIPSALVECGFLSNEDEEKKLQQDEYCLEFCSSLMVGILSFFGK